MQGLLPIYIDYDTGALGVAMYTMGAMGDSYYEYLLKAGPYIPICTARDHHAAARLHIFMLWPARGMAAPRREV
jgi:hypothetical protein